MQTEREARGRRAGLRTWGLYLLSLTAWVTAVIALAAAAAEYLKQGSLPPCPLEVKAGKNVGHVIPQRISGKRGFTLSLRVRQPMKKVTLTVTQNGREVLRRKFPKALPAEMIQLAVAAEKLETTGDLEVSVE